MWTWSQLSYVELCVNEVRVRVLGDQHFLCHRRAHNEQHGPGVDGISMMDTHPTDFYHVDRARMSCQAT